MQVLKQRVARKALEPSRRKRALGQGSLWEMEKVHFWQRRYYDFNVWTERKRTEKLRYMHRNPVKRGLVTEPEQWKWSSFRYYRFGEPGTVRVNEEQVAVMRVRKAA